MGVAGLVPGVCVVVGGAVAWVVTVRVGVVRGGMFGGPFGAWGTVACVVGSGVCVGRVGVEGWRTVLDGVGSGRAYALMRACNSKDSLTPKWQSLGQQHAGSWFTKR